MIFGTLPVKRPSLLPLADMKTHRKWYCSQCKTAGVYEHGDSDAENTEAIRESHAHMETHGCEFRMDAITTYALTA